MRFTLDGAEAEMGDDVDGATLLDVLRDRFGVRSAKDGCSPQGQCGCCTVLVDGAPRVACVTPARRVAGRAVTTLEGLAPAVREPLVQAFLAAGASQCGFCTPGILVRLAALAESERTRPKVESALLAHLCRCTGWQTIVEAATGASGRAGSRPESRPEDADRRATIEGRAPQRVGADGVCGAAGFADDTAPPDALVAVPNAEGEWVVAETLAEARRRAGKVQGRRTTTGPTHPLELPPGDWALTLRTPWVEPGYLEPDASWCHPGGEPASPLANGGAFGAKRSSVVPAIAQRLANEHGRAVRVVLSREDTVRLGPKRPPLAAGLRADGSGTVRVVRTPGVADAIRRVLPLVDVEEVEVAGPPTSTDLRAAGWAEAAVLLAALRADGGAARVESPDGGLAEATVDGTTGAVRVRVAAGRVLDATVLRSYAVGAAHMGLGWVTSEGLHVDDDGRVHDLTIRSFGILRARDVPPIDVEIDLDDDRPPVNGSDAVFAAVAAAGWIARGLPTDWPTERGTFT